MQTHIHKVVVAPAGATGATAQFGGWGSALKFEAIPREVLEHVEHPPAGLEELQALGED